jgi:hypothetical protein
VSFVGKFFSSHGGEIPAMDGDSHWLIHHWGIHWESKSGVSLVVPKANPGKWMDFFQM